MRYIMLAVLVMGASCCFSGCDFGRSQRLMVELEQAEAEKQLLRAENAKFQAELDDAKKRIDDLETKVAQVEKIKEMLGQANDKLPGLLSKYGEKLGDGLNIAKELGLPELKDVPVESLLKNLLGDDKEAQKVEEQKKVEEKKKD